ncbi:MAG TPA: DUF4397 domain-containing protein [Planctomycetes bacterium]|nr:DUF4397 domain-containing protein [Planctomycetota bacterium]
MKRISVPILIVFVLLTSSYGGNSNSSVYVIHGIPGGDLGLDAALPVDVAVQGGCILEGFTYGQAAGPIELPEGTYNIKISLADPCNPCSSTPVIEADVPFSAGETAVVIAHLAEDATPTASKFIVSTNCGYSRKFFNHGDDDDDDNGNNNAYGAYKYCNGTKMVLHHTAAAGAVDIELQRALGWWVGSRNINNITNGEQAEVKVFPGNWAISLFPAGSNDVVLGPIELRTEFCSSYFVFAVGSVDSGSLTLLVYKLNCRNGSELEMVGAVVYVVHGIPGEDLGLDPDLPVDISLNGQCALPGFTFGEITDGLPLIPGVYNVKIGLANPANPCSEPAVIEADVALFAGENVTMIAHLTAEGDPTASVFSNKVGKGCFLFKSPLVVHHTAAAPTVDIEARRHRKVLKLENVSNGDQGILNTRPGPWKVSIAPAGLEDPVFGPLNLRLRNRKVYFLYAVGSLDNETFTVLQNVIPLKNLTD